MGETLLFGIIGAGVIGQVHARAITSLPEARLVAVTDSVPEKAEQTDGYDGFLALVPHLQSAGQFQGFSGPELFHTAPQIFQRLLQTMDWQYA